MKRISRLVGSALLSLAVCLSWMPASTQIVQAVANSNPSGAGMADPAAVFPGEASLLTVNVTPGADPTSTGLTVSANLAAIGGSATQPFFDDGTNGDVTSGDNIFSFSATVASTTAPGVLTLPVTITDTQSRTGSSTIELIVKPPLVAIHDIQGAAHISPLDGLLETTQGVVFALRSDGFYMQDPNPDADPATSEGIFVFTGSDPAVLVGDLAEVVGTVKEFRPGGAGTANLTTTELDNPGLNVTVRSSGNPLPAATVIGAGGRVPPTVSIESDTTGDVETSGVFNPDMDGIDFFESLEGMYVQVNQAAVVGPTTSSGELVVLNDNGAEAAPGLRSPRGGLLVQAGNFNPERIILDDEILKLASQTMPLANVGDKINGSVTGVIDYSSGNFKLEVFQPPVLTSGGLVSEVAKEPQAYQLDAATFNASELSPTDPATKFSALANQIVKNLKSPDILAIEEIQDNSGALDDGVVAANTTWDMLVGAIQSAGGPAYLYRQIDPVNNQDGGATGENLRQGFLFRSDRGLEFVDHAGGTSTTAVAVTGAFTTTELTFSPGRVDPTNPAFDLSRKPLAGEFTFKGDKVFVIAAQFITKESDQPLFGHLQPPTFTSEAQRIQQAQVVHDFAASILAAEPKANVIVLGDVNDYQFSDAVTTLTGSLLNDLVDSLPEAERYTYILDGNSEALDHILLGNPTFNRPFEYEVVHINSEFAAQTSPHDPQASLLCVDSRPPTLTVTVSPDVIWPPNHKYVTVTATVNVSDNADPNASWSLVSLTSNEPDNGIGDGNTTNDVVVIDETTFKVRAERSGVGNGRVYSLAYQAVDACGNVATSNTGIYVPHDMGKLKDLQTQFPSNTSLPVTMRYYLYPLVNTVQFYYLPLITH